MEDAGVLRRCGSSQRQHMLGKHPIWFLRAELWLGLDALRLHLLIVDCDIGEVCDDCKKSITVLANWKIVVAYLKYAASSSYKSYNGSKFRIWMEPVPVALACIGLFF